MKFRKKPVVIEAIQYFRDKNIHEVMNFFGAENGVAFKYHVVDNEYDIITLEGNMRVSKGDWIIKGVKGEFYPCKPDIFNATYEKVEE